MDVQQIIPLSKMSVPKKWPCQVKGHFGQKKGSVVNSKMSTSIIRGAKEQQNTQEFTCQYCSNETR
jgi:hypothetical protein